MIPPPRRIVVTGLGVIAPNGLNLREFWRTVVDGTPSARTVTRFDVSSMPCKLACEISGFEPAKYLDAAKAKRYDRSILYAVAAAKEAVADAGLQFDRIDHDRIGVVEGTSVSGLDNTLKAHTDFVVRGYPSIKPTRLVNAFCGGGASEIAMELGILGQATTIATACSAGNDALGYAARTIRDDIADVMIAGATEAPIIDGYYSIFAAAGVMSRCAGDPAKAMRPFDEHRDGFVVGEGAGFLVLEELSHALARGAKIYAEWLGHGQSCDAHHAVAMHPEGRGMRRAIERALYSADLAPCDVDYVNAHASATEQNDPIEAKVLENIFGPRIAISATKPVTGHLMGASAGIEAVICCLVLSEQVIPPTANLNRLIPGANADFVRGTARPYPVRRVLSNSMGFGGKCASLLLGRLNV